MSVTRVRMLLAAFSMAVVASQGHAETAVALYDIINPGVIPLIETSRGPISEFSEDRLDNIHQDLAPRGYYRPRFESSAIGFAPFYAPPAQAPAYATSDWTEDPYGAWQFANPNPLPPGPIDLDALARAAREPGRGFGYYNLHVQPGLRGSSTPGPGPQTEFGLFDRLGLATSDQPGSGLTENGGTVRFDREDYLSLSSFGRSRGTITPSGEIKLRLDIDPNTGLGVLNPGIAEAVIQGSYSSQMIIDAVTATGTVDADLSFGARVTAPALDFSERDFYSYGVGYSVTVFERRTLENTPGWASQVAFYKEFAETFGVSPEALAEMTDEEFLAIADPDLLAQRDAPAILEHWSSRGLYWMEARQRDPGNILGDEKFVRIESIGIAPPPETPGPFGNYDYDGGIALTVIPLEDLPGQIVEGDPDDVVERPIDTPTLLKHVREFSYDIQDILEGPDAAGNVPWIYNDPLMPFAQDIQETVTLPTQTVLEVVVNFFIAGAVNREFVGSCAVNSPCGPGDLTPDFVIDGSHTAGFGIGFRDPGITLQSLNGFTFPTRALPTPVPLPAALPLFVCALGGLGWGARRRR